jgi:hypothetical protein
MKPLFKRFLPVSIKRLIKKLLEEKCHLVHELDFYRRILAYSAKSPTNFQQSFFPTRIESLELTGIPAVSIKRLLEHEIAGN